MANNSKFIRRHKSLEDFQTFYAEKKVKAKAKAEAEKAAEAAAKAKAYEESIEGFFDSLVAEAKAAKAAEEARYANISLDDLLG